MRLVYFDTGPANTGVGHDHIEQIPGQHFQQLEATILYISDNLLGNYLVIVNPVRFISLLLCLRDIGIDRQIDQYILLVDQLVRIKPNVGPYK
jgi:hypothetical protein